MLSWHSCRNIWGLFLISDLINSDLISDSLNYDGVCRAAPGKASRSNSFVLEITVKNMLNKIVYSQWQTADNISKTQDS